MYSEYENWIQNMLHIKPPAQQALLEALIGVCGAMRDTYFSLLECRARSNTNPDGQPPQRLLCKLYVKFD